MRSVGGLGRRIGRYCCFVHGAELFVVRLCLAEIEVRLDDRLDVLRSVVQVLLSLVTEGGDIGNDGIDEFRFAFGAATASAFAAFAGGGAILGGVVLDQVLSRLSITPCDLLRCVSALAFEPVFEPRLITFIIMYRYMYTIGIMILLVLLPVIIVVLLAGPVWNAGCVVLLLVRVTVLLMLVRSYNVAIGAVIGFTPTVAAAWLVMQVRLVFSMLRASVVLTR